MNEMEGSVVWLLMAFPLTPLKKAVSDSCRIGQHDFAIWHNFGVILILWSLFDMFFTHPAGFHRQLLLSGAQFITCHIMVPLTSLSTRQLDCKWMGE